MSGRDTRPEEQEPFLQRWARLKKQSREQPAAPPVRPLEEDAPAEAATAAADGTGVATDGAGTRDEALPPIESLTPESDLGAFMRPGVDPALRRLALRKMWSNPKYQVVDDLDPFRADFAAFTALGDTITADMKFHAERLLRKQLEEAAEAAGASGVVSEQAAQADEAGPAAAERASGQAADAGDAPDSESTTEDGDERREA